MFCINTVLGREGIKPIKKTRILPQEIHERKATRERESMAYFHSSNRLTGA